MPRRKGTTRHGKHHRTKREKFHWHMTLDKLRKMLSPK